MANLNFKTDLPLGQKGEEIIADLLKTKYGFQIISFNHNNKHDFKTIINNLEKTIEVKTDVYCIPDKEISTPFGQLKVKGRDSGNMFIETECRGKDSGITVSKSDIYVYYYPLLKQAWIIPTNKLKKLITDNNFEFKDKNVGDEGSETKGYVIPRNNVINHFKVIDVSYEWPY